MAAEARTAVDEAFRKSERHLWGLLYRLTGSAADAEDLVQDTFEKALRNPPRDLYAPIRPWLVRVAMNLGRDHLRRRRRRPYVGVWLPEPVETGSAEPPAHEPASLGAEARYDLVESVSTAFLLALEALTPLQRAVLLLRDVFDYDVRETAAALDTTEGSVKTAHHRARRGMRDYDTARLPRTLDASAGTRTALERLVRALGEHDVAAIESILADDVRLYSDGGGEYVAALNPIHGANRVARFLVGIAPGGPEAYRVEIREIGGAPASVVEFPRAPERAAPRGVVTGALSPDGRIREIQIVLASKKLTRVRFGT